MYNSFFQLLLLLSGNISLKPGPILPDVSQILNQCDALRSRGLRFMHFYINSLLSKIEELRYITKSNVAVIRIFESKVDSSVVKQVIGIDNYEILRYDRSRHGGGVPCYIRNDLRYNSLSAFPCEIENIFIEILLPNQKSIIGGIILFPQVKALEVLNNDLQKIESFYHLEIESCFM